MLNKCVWCLWVIWVILDSLLFKDGIHLSIMPHDISQQAAGPGLNGGSGVIDEGYELGKIICEGKDKISVRDHYWQITWKCWASKGLRYKFCPLYLIRACAVTSWSSQYTQIVLNTSIGCLKHFESWDLIYSGFDKSMLWSD